ncbi:MAG TPA: NAD(P)H-quinone oxidoreductase [Thermoanaerobaculia bacterium]|nr:NAD(P)H-quinone oxidoreductase [Thermoanaerobaculia bacterium]
MRAVVGSESHPLADHPLDGPVPRLGELPDPVAGAGEVIVEIAASGLNHADLMQLRGQYPPPPGESEVPGLECAGTILALGEGVETGSGWSVGDRVMALLGGGGLATRVAVPAEQLMPLPENLGFVAGAALPEAGLTAWTNLVAEGGLAAGETVVVTGATGGMGSFIVQLARELGARVIAAGRSQQKLDRLRGVLSERQGGVEGIELLADAADVAGVASRVRALTGGRGADLIVDLVGGARLGDRLEALRSRGRLILLGHLAGARAEIDLAAVLSRRLRLVGSTLRPRPRAEKARLVADFAAFALPRLRDGRLRPVVGQVLPFERVAEAFAETARGGTVGKIVLEA